MLFYNSKILTKGFTLIELLVVIAIIGTLSSVVLSNLNTARGKAANAAVKANLQSLRKEAEIYYDTVGNGSYGSVGTNFTGNCESASSIAGYMWNDPASQKVRTLILAAKAAGNSTNGVKCVSVPPSGGASQYVVAAPLNQTENGNNWWCIDSINGVSKGLVGPITTGMSSCP